MKGDVYRAPYYEWVRDFHEKTGSPYADTFTPLSVDRYQLRKDLIDEEWAEAQEAYELNDHASFIHECLDLLYVIFGTFVELGINPAQGFKAIHDANLNKAGSPKDGRGKVMKGSNYRPADIAEVYGIKSD